MCGIAGLMLRQGMPDEALLAAMAARIAHRGPDETGVHLDGGLGLAHARLSIIDLAGEHQPLFAHDGELALVANGEIYNYIELRALPGLRRHDESHRLHRRPRDDQEDPRSSERAV